MVISLHEVSRDDVEHYSIIKGTGVENSVYRIDILIEKPLYHQSLSNLAILGRYIVTPDIFDKINETKPCSCGEIQFIDVLSKLDEI